MKIKIDRDHDALFVVDAINAFDADAGGGLGVRDARRIVPVHRTVLFPQFKRELTFASIDAHQKGSAHQNTSFVNVPLNYEFTYDEVRMWTPEHHRIAPHAKFTLDEWQGYMKKVGTQTAWNEHALFGTRECDFMEGLSADDFGYITYKGLDPLIDTNSALRNRLGHATNALGALHRRMVRRIFFSGLVYEVCVGLSAIDGVDEFCEVFVIEDATATLGNNEMIDQMWAKLAYHRVLIIQSSDLY